MQKCWLYQISTTTSVFDIILQSVWWTLLALAVTNALFLNNTGKLLSCSNLIQTNFPQQTKSHVSQMLIVMREKCFPPVLKWLMKQENGSSAICNYSVYYWSEFIILLLFSFVQHSRDFDKLPIDSLPKWSLMILKKCQVSQSCYLKDWKCNGNY